MTCDGNATAGRDGLTTLDQPKGGRNMSDPETMHNVADLAAMRKEAIQVAAMALRFAVDVCDVRGGTK